METTTLANSGLTCSRIALGTRTMGTGARDSAAAGAGWDRHNALQAILEAVENGITTIDTAPLYGFGESEALVGEALHRGRLRQHVALSTQAGLDWRDGIPFRDARPQRLFEEVHASLRRLRTDVIDLYQVHWPDLACPLEDTAGAMATLKRQGKIRAVGVSNVTGQQLRAFHALCPLTAVQVPYNLFERGIEEDLLPTARELGISVLGYSALCRGLLSGKMRPHTRFNGDDLRNHDPKFQSPHYAQYLKAVEALNALARDNGLSGVLPLAVRWLLDQPGVDLALWGVRRPEQILPMLELDGWHLDDALNAEIERILADATTDPVGPEFMAPAGR
ncbi:aldo/keto reductase [Alcanivorax sp. 24]|uniref:aldo/keto reductase n=1 Tax=Alcanivorax sp. 24 TaxID=2545266 RepID=UPI0010609255|nr:aldo/keto reductase [Alcanivorax sp. 24]